MTITRQTLLLGVFFLTAPSTLWAAGASGFSFLKIGTSARGTAMAEAMTAIAKGAAAPYYNPAGLLEFNASHSTELLLMHREWIQDTRMQFLGARIGLGASSALGIAVSTTTVADIQIRTRPGPPEGTFTARNFSMGLSYAQSFHETFSGGATVKFLYEKILVDNASGMALDLGVKYSTPLEGLSIGATIANLGSVSELRNEQTKLPALLRIGSGYTMPADDISSTVSLGLDYVQIFPDNQSLLGVGGELLFQETFAIRGGYQFGSQGRGISAGVGVVYSIVALDYGYAPFSSDLGNTHTIAVHVKF